MAEPGLRLNSGGLKSGDGVGGGLGGGDGASKRDIGNVVDGTGEPPDAAASCLELTEVHLPDAAASCRRVKEDSAAGPGQLAPLRLVALGQKEPASTQGSCHR